MGLLAVQKDENRQKKGSAVSHVRPIDVVHLQSTQK
jgi:hypothetical protein